MGEIIRMVVVLSLICGLSGLTLASVREATKGKIEEQVMTYVQGPALEQIFQNYENNPVRDRKTFTDPADGRNITVFPIRRNGALVGVAFESSAKGFGGDLGVMVGFDMQKNAMAGIGMTTMKETPGVGTRVALPNFTRQFVGHGEDSVALSKNGGDIDAVSGATISSTGAVNAVQKALVTFKALQPELAKAFTS